MISIAEKGFTFISLNLKKKKLKNPIMLNLNNSIVQNFKREKNSSKYMIYQEIRMKTLNTEIIKLLIMKQIRGKKLIFNTIDENLAESQKISIFAKY